MVPQTQEIFKGKEDLESFLVKKNLDIHALIKKGVLWKVDKVKEYKSEVLKMCPLLRLQCRTEVKTEKIVVDVYRHQTRDFIVIDVDPRTMELYGENDPRALDLIRMTGQSVKFLIEAQVFKKICSKVVERTVKQQSYQRYKHTQSGMKLLIFAFFYMFSLCNHLIFST